MKGRLALNERERSERLIKTDVRSFAAFGSMGLAERGEHVRRVRRVRPHFVVFATVSREIGSNLSF
jgi:hypothetical protein